MKLRWSILVLSTLLGLGTVAEPAMARVKHFARVRHIAKPHCVYRPASFSFYSFFYSTPPRPNGCTPAVFYGGEYIGQDPDPNIRRQLLRDPGTGYTSFF